MREPGYYIHHEVGDIWAGPFECDPQAWEWLTTSPIMLKEAHGWSCVRVTHAKFPEDE